MGSSKSFWDLSLAFHILNNSKSLTSSYYFKNFIVMMADFENAEFYYCVHQWRAATYIHIYPFVMRSSPLLGIGMHNQRIWGLKDYQEGHSSYFMSIIRREILLFFLLGLLLCVFSCNLSMLCLNDEQKKSTTDIIYILCSDIFVIHFGW